MDKIRMNASKPVKAAPMMRDFPATIELPKSAKEQLQKMKSFPKKAPKILEKRIPQKMKKTRKYYA
jgi:hypothetical protein